MHNASSLVFIVDDDRNVGRALVRLLHSLGLRAESFLGAHEVLGCDRLLSADCFILDVHLHGTTGFDLAEKLAAHGVSSPVLFMTGHAETRLPTTAARDSVLLSKPLEFDEIIDALKKALGKGNGLPHFPP